MALGGESGISWRGKRGVCVIVDVPSVDLAPDGVGGGSGLRRPVDH